MLPKKHRLARTKDVKKTLEQGRGFFNSFFTVKFKKTTAPPRFTVVVSTKVSKSAVQRNRIKRVLRESLRTKLAEFPFGDYVIMVKPKACSLKGRELSRQFEFFLNSNIFSKTWD